MDIITKEKGRPSFPRYPELLKAYELAFRLGNIFTICKSKQVAFKRLAIWYNDVEDDGIVAFKTVARSVGQHDESILNFLTTVVQMTPPNLLMLKLKLSGHHLEA